MKTQVFERQASFYNAFGGYQKPVWDLSVSLQTINQVLTRDLPFSTKLSVELMGGGKSKTSVIGDVCGRKVFKLDDVCIYSCGDERKAFIGIDEVRIDPEGKAPQYKGAGIGKILLANCAALCAEFGISRLRLTAGRENGALFWARHGFDIEELTPQHNFWKTEESYQNIKEQLPLQMRQHIEDIFIQAHKDAQNRVQSSANRDLAVLDIKIGDRPLNQILFKGVEYRAVLDFKNENQLEAFRQSMKNIDSIRFHVARRVEEKTPKDQNGTLPVPNPRMARLAALPTHNGKSALKPKR